MDTDAFKSLKEEVEGYGAKVVAVSKTRSVDEIRTLYELGQLDFGENKVQEWMEKHGELPRDIRWHLIGHLQSNKVKYLDPVPYLIHSADRKKLIKALDKEASSRDIDFHVLLQIKIADEESKFGFEWKELIEIATNGFFSQYPHVKVRGVMGMSTLTEDQDQIREEFRTLRSYYEKLLPYFDADEFTEVSMGMSGDYKIALEEGSTIVRVGSLIFGPRNY